MKKAKPINPNPTERKLFFHRLTAQKYYGSAENADKLIEMLGDETAAQMSREEFLKRLEEEFPLPAVKREDIFSTIS